VISAALYQTSLASSERFLFSWLPPSQFDASISLISAYGFLFSLSWEPSANLMISVELNQTVPELFVSGIPFGDSRAIPASEGRAPSALFLAALVSLQCSVPSSRSPALAGATPARSSPEPPRSPAVSSPHRSASVASDGPNLPDTVFFPTAPPQTNERSPPGAVSFASSPVDQSPARSSNAATESLSVSESAKRSESQSIGLVIGVVVGAVLLVIVGLLLFLLLRGRKGTSYTCQAPKRSHQTK
jgi:hypothetical protein